MNTAGAGISSHEFRGEAPAQRAWAAYLKSTSHVLRPKRTSECVHKLRRKAAIYIFVYTYVFIKRKHFCIVSAAHLMKSGYHKLYALDISKINNLLLNLKKFFLHGIINRPDLELCSIMTVYSKWIIHQSEEGFYHPETESLLSIYIEGTNDLNFGLNHCWYLSYVV